MSQPFDPYYRWLGIPPEEQPPDHYRLLGVRRFEGDPEVISNAADRQMLHVRSFQTGPRAADCQRLLNELSAARTCLLNAAKKTAYDHTLAATAPNAIPLATQPLSTSPLPAAMPPATPHPAKTPSSALPPPAAVPAAHAGSPEGPMPAQPLASGTLAGSRAPMRGSPSRRSRRGGRTSPLRRLVEVVLGGAVGIALAMAVLWFGFGVDPLGIAERITPGDSLTQNTGETSNPSRRDAAARDQGGPLDAGSREEQPPNASRPSGTAASPRGKQASGGRATENRATGDNRRSSSDASAPGNDSVNELLDLDAPSTPPGTPPGRMPNPRPFGAPLAPEERHPVPDEAQQRVAFQRLQEVAGQDLTPGSKPAERRARLRRLLQLSRELYEEPDVQYVVLREAYRQACQFGQDDEAGRAVDELVANFAVNEIAARSQMLKDFALLARTPPDQVRIADAALKLAERAFAAKQFSDAVALAELAESQAGKAKFAAGRALARERGASYKRAERGVAAFQKAQDQLAANPEDSQARTVVGRYLILYEGDFEQGLPHLAQGEEPKLKALAERDLQSASATPEEQTALAQAWFDLASSDAELTPLLARARHWYRRAEPGASGLMRVAIRNQLKAIDEAEEAGRFVDRTATKQDDDAAFDAAQR